MKLKNLKGKFCILYIYNYVVSNTKIVFIYVNQLLKWYKICILLYSTIKVVIMIKNLKKKIMKNICLFIQWITFGKVCLGYCNKKVCKKAKKK